MFDKPVDTSAVYGSPVWHKKKMNPSKQVGEPRLVEKKRYYNSTKTYREYQEMRKTPEFWVWWKRQYARQEAKCYYCLESLRTRRVNVEHIVPMSRGGQNTRKNMVLSCADCNKEKGRKLLSRGARHEFKKRRH